MMDYGKLFGGMVDGLLLWVKCLVFIILLMALALVCMWLWVHTAHTASLSGKTMEPLGLLYAMRNDIDGATRFIEGFR